MGRSRPASCATIQRIAYDRYFRGLCATESNVNQCSHHDADLMTQKTVSREVNLKLIIFCTKDACFQILGETTEFSVAAALWSLGLFLFLSACLPLGHSHKQLHPCLLAQA